MIAAIDIKVTKVERSKLDTPLEMYPLANILLIICWRLILRMESGKM